MGDGGRFTRRKVDEDQVERLYISLDMKLERLGHDLLHDKRRREDVAFAEITAAEWKSLRLGHHGEQELRSQLAHDSRVALAGSTAGNGHLGGAFRVSSR